MKTPNGPAPAACTVWFADRDDDGRGDPNDNACLAAAAPPHTAATAGDCDDADPDTYDGAAETCDDAADNDCDGRVDESGALGCQERWADLDQDGFGGESLGCVCSLAGGVDVPGDCSDRDPDSFPGAAEAEPSLCARDADADGYGSATTDGQTEAGTDCDDGDATAFPGAPAPCNDGVDQACDGGQGCRLDAQQLPDTAVAVEFLHGTAGPNMVLCDVSHDGHPEIFIATNHASADKLWRIDGLADAEGALVTWLRIADTEFHAADFACGDLDGDGSPELVAGLWGTDSAWVLPSGDASAGWPLEGDAGGSFGESVAVLGDLDGDSAGELAIGDHLRGQVWWSPGGGGALHAGPSDPTPEAYFGATLCNAGDVDGDGLDDLVVGAYGEADYAGAAYLFAGSAGRAAGAASDAQARWGGALYAGAWLAGGDLDADGYSDVVVSGAASSSHSVTIVRGGASPASAELGSADIQIELASNRITNLSIAGDTDADGYPDLLIGSYEPWAAWLVYGASTMPSGDVDEVGVAFRGPRNRYSGAAVGMGQLDGEAGSDLVLTATSSSGSDVYAILGSGR